MMEKEQSKNISKKISQSISQSTAQRHLLNPLEVIVDAL